MSRRTWPAALSVGVYQHLLRVYPTAFRQHYGRPMAHVFQDCCRAAYRRHGGWGLLLLWNHTLRDLVATGTHERLNAWREGNHFMSTPARIHQLWPLSVALILALVVTYVNLHVDETGIIALPIILAAAVLGFVRPRGAILWGLLLGAGIPLGQAWAAATGLQLPYPNSWADVRATLTVPVVPLLAALLGAGTRWITTRLTADGG